jgi:hypothetical protein
MTGSPLNVILRPGYAISEAADMMRIVGVDCDLRRDEQRSKQHSVPAQHQCLDGQQQGLNPQQQRVHEAGGVDDMQPEALERTDLA